MREWGGMEKSPGVKTQICRDSGIGESLRILSTVGGLTER